jgi:hypothetical protein
MTPIRGGASMDLGVFAEQQRRAAVRALQAEQQGMAVDLPAPLGPGAQHLAAIDREIQAIERRDRTEALVRAVQAGEGCWTCRPP